MLQSTPGTGPSGGTVLGFVCCRQFIFFSHFAEFLLGGPFYFPVLSYYFRRQDEVSGRIPVLGSDRRLCDHLTSVLLPNWDSSLFFLQPRIPHQPVERNNSCRKLLKGSLVIAIKGKRWDLLKINWQVAILKGVCVLIQTFPILALVYKGIH